MDLNALQAQLEYIYDVRTYYRVEDFLITDPTLVRRLTEEAAGKGQSVEALLIRQSKNNLDLALYLNQELLTRLVSDNPSELLHDGNLAEFWFVLEGVSHFLYLAWNVGFERTVTQLELELQAEIDKFVLTAALIYRQRGIVDMRLLRRTLFEEIRFRDGLDDIQQQRYQEANRLAARYCGSLEEKYSFIPRNSYLVNELRRFYRMPQSHKIRHIRVV
ncbi:hypothetical protein Noc_2984 [Nitrosococcus oceani ATCC 19707]|uniref:Uncharacterized protein n=2 Tax=Nitrosococcus oceani TaxID=1229 RepID=Q3J6X0_NITOC|nr:hypothetical protein [Nitrosococcus oceani]ABA59426.1 hypothetical protein Noc_2984 [Nitrosococcus oceani ATCC 19707]EDZ66455.1 hypothetical protein NOC27_3135 [Nitrosococcus oceani AFC27]KFI18168.1 hypothetical protein IB75_15860 [Nitrosococcus oceani C-27]GEM20003.1 hypothetical protein NONS58_14070 [Nitrosococcus oceani]